MSIAMNVHLVVMECYIVYNRYVTLSCLTCYCAMQVLYILSNSSLLCYAQHDKLTIPLKVSQMMWSVNCERP